MVKGLTDIFLMRKMAVSEICTADLNAYVISATSLGWRGHFFIILEVKEREKVRVLEC